MDDYLLQLPADAVNGGRSVPGGCAICLESYEPGDRVAWSKFDSCKHAFHHDCVIQWLSQKQDDRPLCPCCRQDFCSVSGNNAASNNSHQYPTRDTLVTAATLSDFIRMRQAEFMLPITTTTDDGTVSITSLPTEQFATSANETTPPNENDVEQGTTTTDLEPEEDRQEQPQQDDDDILGSC